MQDHIIHHIIEFFSREEKQAGAYAISEYSLALAEDAKGSLANEETWCQSTAASLDATRMWTHGRPLFSAEHARTPAVADPACEFIISHEEDTC